MNLQARVQRTRFSDDYLWLPYVAVEYISATGDYDILKIEAPFLEDDALKQYEDERYCQPRITKEEASVFEHCIRSIEYGLRFGGSADCRSWEAATGMTV